MGNILLNKGLLILLLLSSGSFHAFGISEYQPNTECYDNFVSEWPGRRYSCLGRAKNGSCTYENDNIWMKKNCRRSCHLCQIALAPVAGK